MSTAELAVSYAALILADDGIEITVRSSLFLCLIPSSWKMPSNSRNEVFLRGELEPRAGGSRQSNFGPIILRKKKLWQR